MSDDRLYVTNSMVTKKVRLSDYIDKVRILSKLFCKEVSSYSNTYKESDSNNINWEYLLMLEDCGDLVFIIVTDLSEVYGFSSWIKTSDINDSTISTLRMINLFIHPDKQKKYGGLLLIKHAEQIAKELEITGISITVHVDSKIDVLAERLGFHERCIEYYKSI